MSNPEELWLWRNYPAGELVISGPGDIYPTGSPKYLRADLAQAREAAAVAAALEGAVGKLRAWERNLANVGKDDAAYYVDLSATIVRALIPAAAKSALDAMIEAAVKAERERIVERAEMLAKEVQAIVAADRWKGRDLSAEPPEKWHRLRPETQQLWIDTATRILAAIQEPKP